MEAKNEKSNKITWWHLIAAGGGISVLYSMSNKTSSLALSIISALLIVVGMVWGIYLGFKYLVSHRKMEQKIELLKKYWIFATCCLLLVIIGAFFIFSKKEETVQVVPSSENDLTQEEMNMISKSIVQLECRNQNDDPVYGTGVYLNKYSLSKKDEDFVKTLGSDYHDGYVLTNAHVTWSEAKEEANYCRVMFDKLIQKKFTSWDVVGFFFTSDQANIFASDGVDFALLEYEDNLNDGYPGRPSISDKELSDLRLPSILPACDRSKVKGNKVYVFGYPASANEYTSRAEMCREFPNYEKSIKSIFGPHACDSTEPILDTRNLIISNGIISGTDSAGNYYTTAKIDAGNSGGLAVSKINGVICIVGIPTWLSSGYYDNLGVIQPFEKISYIFQNAPKP